VNNHERLVTMPNISNVRFDLVFENTTTLQIPSNRSNALVVSSGTWFVWPFRFKYSNVQIGWATAQILCSVQIEKNKSVLILVASSNVDVEIAIDSSESITIHGSTATSSLESPWTVVRNIVPSTSSQITVSTKLDIVVLPHDLADRVWKGTFLGKDRVFISDENVNFVLTTENEIQIRANTSQIDAFSTMNVNVSMLPYCPVSLNEEEKTLNTSPDGMFTRVHIPIQTRPLPAITWNLQKQAHVLRPLVNASSGKIQEPTCEDWKHFASEYDVIINYTSAYDKRDELRLAVQYDGDSARFLFNDKLLADNWFSGYDEGAGQMEVGLSYLSEENPGLLLTASTVHCTLKLLPLNKKVIDSRIYIQSGHWPKFNESGIALGVRNLVPLRITYATLVSSSL